MEKLLRVVLTGGPCGGKSKTLSALEKAFQNDIVLVPEAATILISGGFPRPGHGVSRWSQAWQDEFEHATIATQRALERLVEKEALVQGKRLMIHDRSCLDGAAYVDGTIEAFCEQYGLSLSEEFGRFDMIIHLQSLAAWAPTQYELHTEGKRLEDLPHAKVREAKLLDVWKDHPRRVIIPGSENLKEKVDRVTSLIGDLLSKSAPCKDRTYDLSDVNGTLYH